MKSEQIRLLDFQFFSEDHRKTNEEELKKIINENDKNMLHYVLLGLICRERNDYLGAESYFRYVLDRDRNDPDANIYSCMLLREKKMFSEAELKLASLRNIIRGNQQWRIYLERGLLLLDQKKYEESISELQRALKLDPENGEILWNIGILYLHKYDYKRSEQFLIDSIKYDNTFYSSRISLANLYFNQGDLQKSLTVLCENLPETLNKCERYHQKAMICKGRLWLLSGEKTKSEEILKKTVESFPNFAIGYDYLGYTYSSQNKISEAERLYRKAISIDKFNVESYFNLSRIQCQMGLINQAEETLQKLQHFIDPSNFWQIDLFRSINLREQGDIKTSNEIIANVIEKNNDNHLIFYNMALVNQKQKHFEEAIKQYEKSIELDRYFLPAYWQAVYCYRAQKNNNKILSLLKKIELIGAEHLFWKIHCEKSLCFSSLGRKHEGKVELQRAIERGGEALMNLKKINEYAKSGNYHDISLQCYSKMLEQDDKFTFS